MSALSPIQIVIALLIGGLGVYLVAAPRRAFSRPEDPAEFRPGVVELDSDHGRRLRLVVAPTLILLGLGLLGIALLGSPERLEARLALASGAGAAPLLFGLVLPSARPQTLKDAALLVLGSAYLGGMVFDLYQPMGSPRSPFVDLLLFAFFVVLVGTTLRDLAVNWGDEARLAALFQYDIERPRRISIRAKALLTAIAFAAMLALMTFFLVQNLFLSE